VDANENNDYVLLIPKEPLNDGASYTVSIKGTYDEEDTVKKFHKKWLFTTESYGRPVGLTPSSKMNVHLNGKPLSLKQQPIVVTALRCFRFVRFLSPWEQRLNGMERPAP
jgi:hypothetical protein